LWVLCTSSIQHLPLNHTLKLANVIISKADDADRCLSVIIKIRALLFYHSLKAASVSGTERWRQAGVPWEANGGRPAGVTAGVSNNSRSRFTDHRLHPRRFLDAPGKGRTGDYGATVWMTVIFRMMLCGDNDLWPRVWRTDVASGVGMRAAGGHVAGMPPARIQIELRTRVQILNRWRNLKKSKWTQTIGYDIRHVRYQMKPFLYTCTGTCFIILQRGDSVFIYCVRFRPTFSTLALYFILVSACLWRSSKFFSNGWHCSLILIGLFSIQFTVYLQTFETRKRGKWRGWMRSHIHVLSATGNRYGWKDGWHWWNKMFTKLR